MLSTVYAFGTLLSYIMRQFTVVSYVSMFLLKKYLDALTFALSP